MEEYKFRISGRNSDISDENYEALVLLQTPTQIKLMVCI
jgi:hypothetical protein